MWNWPASNVACHREVRLKIPCAAIQNWLQEHVSVPQNVQWRHVGAGTCLIHHLRRRSWISSLNVMTPKIVAKRWILRIQVSLGWARRRRSFVRRRSNTIVQTLQQTQLQESQNVNFYCRQYTTARVWGWDCRYDDCACASGRCCGSAQCNFQESKGSPS